MNFALSKKKGFTLVEILIVLAVISMVILLGVSSYGIVRKKIRLDIATNSAQSTIIEARDKARAGYYNEASAGTDVVDASSLCFGFTVKSGGYVIPLSSGYNRLLTEGSRCDKQNAKETVLTDLDKDIVVKDLFLYGENAGDELTVFFAPPNSNIEFEKPLITSDSPELKIVFGYADSDDDLNKREVILNLLTGGVYSQTFNKNDE